MDYPDLAHVVLDAAGEYRLHELEDHLASVGELAAQFAQWFQAGDCARLAGRWHDLGKFQPAFQAYIRRGSGFDAEAHVEEGAPGRVDHSTVGAIHAVEHLGSAGPRGAALGRLLAYVVAGHHAGLPDWHMADGGNSALEARLESRRDLYNATRAVEASDPWLEGAVPNGGPPSRASTALWVRMLFSALVDADFLDTEAFMSSRRTKLRSGWRPLPEIAESFEAFMPSLKNTGSLMDQARADVLRWCREASELPPGLFSLTVPTGGGKTLSSMAFALRHALRYGKRRIIYVIPYTSIIEQTVDVFRRALVEETLWTVVLEHHSNLDPAIETYRTRLAAENWDAPVVVTTSLQFFESLFAARTSRVRKLHNVAESVVILDEVQLLPADFLLPVLDALGWLTEHFGTTVLLMTATQPAWREPAGGSGGRGLLEHVREIVPDPAKLHQSLQRVRVDAPEDLNVQMSWPEVAGKMLEHPSALCVVNRRQDARDLFELIQEEDPEALHLSALMSGSHRSRVISQIRQLLGDGKPARVVSTQLVEAGVDIDFPVVFRALAGLDSIAQAAGRCNREGRGKEGLVQVFVPPTNAPRGILRKAEGVTRALFTEGLDDPLAPRAFERFFRSLYWLHGESLDKHAIRDLLDHTGERADLTYSFRTAAREFRLIKDEQQVGVVVRWPSDPRSSQIADAIIELCDGEPTRATYRTLQRSLVTVYRYRLRALQDSGSVVPLHDDLFLQVDPAVYDERLGLLL